MEPLQYKISEHSLGQIVLPPSPAVLAQALTNMEKYHYFIISTGEDLCMRALRDSGLVGLELFKGLLPNWDKLALESVNSRILFWKEVGERVLASSPYLSVFQRLVACYEEFFPPTCRAAAYFLAELDSHILAEELPTAMGSTVPKPFTFGISHTTNPRVAAQLLANLVWKSPVFDIAYVTECWSSLRPELEPLFLSTGKLTSDLVHQRNQINEYPAILSKLSGKIGLANRQIRAEIGECWGGGDDLPALYAKLIEHAFTDFESALENHLERLGFCSETSFAA